MLPEHVGYSEHYSFPLLTWLDMRVSDPAFAAGVSAMVVQLLEEARTRAEASETRDYLRAEVKRTVSVANATVQDMRVAFSLMSFRESSAYSIDDWFAVPVQYLYFGPESCKRGDLFVASRAAEDLVSLFRSWIDASKPVDADSKDQ